MTLKKRIQVTWRYSEPWHCWTWSPPPPRRRIWCSTQSRRTWSCWAQHSPESPARCSTGSFTYRQSVIKNVLCICIVIKAVLPLLSFLPKGVLGSLNECASVRITPPWCFLNLFYTSRALNFKKNSQNIVLVKNQFFAYLPKILSRIKENLSQIQMHFTINALL